MDHSVCFQHVRSFPLEWLFGIRVSQVVRWGHVVRAEFRASLCPSELLVKNMIPKIHVELKHIWELISFFLFWFWVRTIWTLGVVELSTDLDHERL